MSWRTARYASAVVALSAGAIGMQLAKENKWLVVLKKPLPILRPLHDLDRTVLRPFVFGEQRTLAADTIEELGTDEYVEWAIEHRDPPKGLPAQALLFVTYYTGVHDQVPHVAEECYVQGAFTPAGSDELSLSIPELGVQIPVTRLAFFPPRELVSPTYVYYTICANGDFYAGRWGVRNRIAQRDESHAYYSKVEISFTGSSENDPAVVDRAALELMKNVVVELVSSHWPPGVWAKHGPAPSGGGPVSDHGGE